MKAIILISLTSIVFISVCFRFMGYLYWNLPLFLSFIGIAIVYLINLNKNYPYKKSDRPAVLLKIATVLMSVALICRYFYIDATNLITFFYIPFYAALAIIFISLKKIQEFDLKFVSVIYLILIAPMIISNINNGPRTINHSNKNPYDDVIHEKIELPYKFEDERAQKLGQAARGLRKKKRYHEAILLYSKARKIELENPLPLFYLFETYALMGDLDQAIKALDSAIVLDNSYPVLHINRGLMYYKLDNNPEAIINYKNAIQLDSTMTAVHTNLALAYYYSNEFDLACESVAKAVKLGFNVSEVKLLYEMQQSKCK